MKIDFSIQHRIRYVAEIEAMGLDELKAIHESSYARVLAAQQG